MTREELAIWNAAWFSGWNAAVEQAACLAEGTQLVGKVSRVTLPTGETVRQRCAALCLDLADDMRAALPLKAAGPHAAYVVCHDDRDYGAMEVWPAASLAEAQERVAYHQDETGVDGCHWEAYETLPPVKIWKLHADVVTAAQYGGTLPCSICGMTPAEHNDEKCRKEYES